MMSSLETYAADFTLTRWAIFMAYIRVFWKKPTAVGSSGTGRCYQVASFSTRINQCWNGA